MGLVLMKAKLESKMKLHMMPKDESRLFFFSFLYSMQKIENK